MLTSGSKHLKTNCFEIFIHRKKQCVFQMPPFPQDFSDFNALFCLKNGKSNNIYESNYMYFSQFQSEINILLSSLI